jgi:hypothetical protein
MPSVTATEICRRVRVKRLHAYQDAVAVLLTRHCVLHRFSGEVPHHLPGARDVIGAWALEIRARA